MVKTRLPLTILLLIVLSLVSCIFIPQNQDNAHEALYTGIAAWINGNALNTESIAGPERSMIHLVDRQVIPIPSEARSSDALGIIRKGSPDYVLAFNSIMWNGVIRQPWFQQRYKPLYTFFDHYDTIAPAVIYAYAPSRFDTGETINVAQNFTGEAPVITSYQIDTTRIFPGRSLHLTLTWQAASALYAGKVDLALMIYSEIEKRPVYTLLDTFQPEYETFYDTTFIRTYHTFILPSELAVGQYNLRVSLSQENGAPLPVETSTGELLNFLNLLTLERPSLVGTQEIIPAFPTTYHFLEEDYPVISLAGYDTFTQTTTGTRMRVDLVWRCIQSLTGDYTVFVHIRDTENNVVAQADNKPLNWTFPTNQWQTGQYIYDEHNLDIAEDLAHGSYFLYVGLYDAQTGQRLPILQPSGDRLANDEILLSPIRIR